MLHHDVTIELDWEDILPDDGDCHRQERWARIPEELEHSGVAADQLRQTVSDVLVVALSLPAFAVVVGLAVLPILLLG